MHLFKKHYVLITLFIVITGIPLVFLSNTVAMANVWITNETFTHGFFVLPITLWLIWQKRDFLRGMTPLPEPRVLILLLCLLSLWFVSNVVGVEITQQFALVSIIISLVWLILGRQILIYLSFPLLFLFFAVPAGQSLIPVMMEFTADFTVFMIKLTGIPIYRDGLFFTLPSGNWSVVEECSGVRYLIASLALGTIYSYISYTSYPKRFLFILISVIVPVLANGLRAFGIVMLGHLSGMKLAVGVDHLVYGWVFFGAVIFILFYIGSFWWDPIEENQDIPADYNKDLKIKQPALLLLAGLGLILSTKLYSHHINNKEILEPMPAGLEITENFNAWQFEEDRWLNWKPILKSADLTLSRLYRFGDERVQLDIGYYHHQKQGAEAVSSNNKITNPYAEGDWAITSQVDYQDKQLYVTESEIRKTDNKLLVWQWYRIGNLKTPNPYIAKVFDAYNKMITGRTDASYITISTIMDENKPAARQRLSDFIENAMNDINLKLEQAPGK